jgi:hypothetical protein
MSIPLDFIAGAITMGYLTVAVFFLKFWRRTRDSLFLIFAGAFCLLAANQTAVVLVGNQPREAGIIYLMRLAAFILIIVAVTLKNTPGGRRI